MYNTFTAEKEEARYAIMPKAGIIERNLYTLALWADRQGMKLEQKRIDKAPPCSCGDAHCDRNIARGIRDW